jgi:hypothetical protein
MIIARSFLTSDIVPRPQLLIWTATALASGLAAMLLTILSNDTGKTWDPVARHGRHEKINNILVWWGGYHSLVQTDGHTRYIAYIGS